MADPSSLSDADGLAILSLIAANGGSTQALWPKGFESLAAVVGDSASKASPIATQYHADEGTLLASTPRTATVQSPDQTNHGWSGVVVVVDVSNIVATPSVVPSIMHKEIVTGDYVSIADFIAITDVTGTGKYYYYIMPGTVTPAFADPDVEEVELNTPLPPTWRWEMVHGDGDSITYSVSYYYFRS